MTEIPEEQETPAVQMEDIHPRMSEEDKRRAVEEIMRVLRGDS
jgi:hypothetical protein